MTTQSNHSQNETAEPPLRLVGFWRHRKECQSGVLLLLLGVLTAVCYWPLMGHRFIGLDDPTYILLNKHIQQGLTWQGVTWAFTSGYASNWHPVTWLSHMLDCQLFGLNPAGHHLVNLLLHTLNTLLLFLVLRQMTGTVWRSALVAALFAWHPLHVESVAWAAERKDVLSTFFFLLTISAYARYVELGGLTPGALTPAPRERGRWFTRLMPAGTGFYLLALVLFALGLMSKPMVVTLPCVLLLLDFWPLRRSELERILGTASEVLQPTECARELSHPSLLERIRALWKCRRSLLRLFLEKVPFFVLSVAASVVTYYVQKAGGAVSSLTAVPLGARAANAIVAYMRYLDKTLQPVNLSVFYPLPDHWPVAMILGSVLVLAIITGLVARAWQGYPFLLVGWLWFLGTLVPTIGLVQVGSQSMADRYMYIPSIGLFVMAVWGLGKLAHAGSRLSWLVPSAAVAALVACLSLTSVQLSYWYDEQTLSRHALAIDPSNYMALDHMAHICEATGRNDEAVSYYQALLQLKPRYPQGQFNLGTLLMRSAKLHRAERHLRAALQLEPNFAKAECNLGLTLFHENKLEQSLAHLQRAVQLDPQQADYRVNLGVTLLALNRCADAIHALSRAVSLDPAAPEPHLLLSVALSRENKAQEALAQAERARELATVAKEQALVAKADALARECRVAGGL